MASIKLKAKQIESLYYAGWEDDDCEDKTVVKDFEGWSISADENTGSFDSAKSAMVDYKILLFDPEGNCYKGTGGYFIQGEHYFSHDITFYAPNPKTPISELNTFLDNLVHENLDLKSKVEKIKKYLEKLES